MAYKCERCEKTFNYKHVLTKHQNKKTPCDATTDTSTTPPVVEIKERKQSAPLVNININYTASSLEDVKNILNFINTNYKNNIVNVAIIEPEPVAVVQLEPETVAVVQLEPEPVASDQEEEKPKRQKMKKEPKKPVEVLKKDMLDKMKVEYEDEKARYSKFIDHGIKTQKLNDLLKKYEDNIKKVNEAKRVPKEAPTVKGQRGEKYANYSPEELKSEYKKVFEEIQTIQEAANKQAEKSNNADSKKVRDILDKIGKLRLSQIWIIKTMKNKKIDFKRLDDLTINN